MDNREAAAVVAIFAAAFPNTNVTAATVSLWADNLRSVNAQDGLDVARLLVTELEWFPTIAQFRQRQRDLVRNRQLDVAHKALPAPDIPLEQQKANVAKLAQMVGQVGSNPKIDPKFVGLPRRQKPAFHAPMCSKEDHSDCGYDASAHVPRGLSTSEKRKIARGEK